MRVLKGLVVSLNSRMPLIEKPLVLSTALGGERQRSSVGFDMGYSEAVQCIGTHSYLESNSQSLQKPVGGRLFSTSNRQANVEPLIPPLYKGGIVCSEQISAPTRSGKTRAKTNISRTATYCPVNIIMTYCPECGGEMHYEIATKHYVCKSCGLSVTRQELMELREKLRPSTETAEEEKEKHRKEYLKWWLSKKK